MKGNVAVYIGTSGQATEGATIYGNVYGGGALGNTNVDTSGTPTADTKTDVNLFKGTIYGNVFGGGLGRKAEDAVLYSSSDPEVLAGTKTTSDVKTPAVSAVAAIVGGDVNVLLDGAKLNCTYTGVGENRMPLSGQIFGANNLNGTPKGHVKVWVKRTITKAFFLRLAIRCSMIRFFASTASFSSSSNLKQGDGSSEILS